MGLLPTPSQSWDGQRSSPFMPHSAHSWGTGALPPSQGSCSQDAALSEDTRQHADRHGPSPSSAPPSSHSQGPSPVGSASETWAPQWKGCLCCPLLSLCLARCFSAAHAPTGRLRRVPWTTELAPRPQRSRSLQSWKSDEPLAASGLRNASQTTATHKIHFRSHRNDPQPSDDTREHPPKAAGRVFCGGDSPRPT